MRRKKEEEEEEEEEGRGEKKRVSWRSYRRRRRGRLFCAGLSRYVLEREGKKGFDVSSR